MKAIKTRISLFSADPDSLTSFYTNLLGFRLVVKIDRPGEYGTSVEIAPGYKIWIARHSEVDGKSKDPFRIMISIFVDDIQAYFEAVRSFNSSLIIDEPVLVCSEIANEERWAGSFFDVDGNCVQLMQMTGK
jgi:hypothetical protein